MEPSPEIKAQLLKLRTELFEVKRTNDALNKAVAARQDQLLYAEQMVKKMYEGVLAEQAAHGCQDQAVAGLWAEWQKRYPEITVNRGVVTTKERESSAHQDQT